MIPKIIHYCWFGRHEKTALAKHCISTWQKVQPDFEILEWNEDNSPLEDNAYVREAFSLKKWAFVSDYVRSKIMLEHGGFYLDTDMELNLPLNDFLNERAICGFEVKGVPYSAFWAAEKGHRLARDFVDYYQKQPGFEERINTDIFSEMLEKNYGADRFKDEIQHLKNGITLYASEYFSQALPKNYVSHHFSGSWFGGDAENTHKTMVNVYGNLERIIRTPNADKAVTSIIHEHKIIKIDDLLDLIPQQDLESYLERKK